MQVSAAFVLFRTLKMNFYILWLALLSVRNLLLILEVILLKGSFLFTGGENNHSQCPVSAERCSSDASERVFCLVWGMPSHLEGAKLLPSSWDQLRTCPYQACRLLTFPRRRRWWTSCKHPSQCHAVLSSLDVAWGRALEHVGGSLHMCDHHPYWVETSPCGCFGATCSWW